MNKLRKLSIFILLIQSILILSCEKSDQANSKVKSPFTVKYELVSSNGTFLDGSLRYTNSALGIISTGTWLNGNYLLKQWSETFTVTAENRPLLFTFKATSLSVKSSSTVTGNIYINGIVKATLEVPTKIANGSNYANIDMQYTVE